MTRLDPNKNCEGVHALSFDVEEHFQVSAFWSQLRRGAWDQLESRVERNTRKIADLLAKFETKATFFILGWVAERHPGLVKDLVNDGHEVASHGYGHELVTGQTPLTFREDVRRAKGILEEISGKPVLGYRAPSFSITSETEWALSILVEEGHLYDSSIYHKFRERYGNGYSNSQNYQIKTSAGSLWEVPPSTMKTCGVHIPVAGGGYFRLMPYPMLKVLLTCLVKDGVQLVMYLHPWEIDPHQPRMEGSLLSRIRHYMNLDKTEQRLCHLLEDFSFGSIVEVMQPISESYQAQAKSRINEPSFEQSPEWMGSDVIHRQQARIVPLL